MVTSGIRIGTPALTTRGMKEAEMRRVGILIDEAIVHRHDEKALEKVRHRGFGADEKVPYLSRTGVMSQAALGVLREGKETR